MEVSLIDNNYAISYPEICLYCNIEAYFVFTWNEMKQQLVEDMSVDTSAPQPEAPALAEVPCRERQI